MTVKQLINRLSSIKPSLQDKEVRVLQPNGEYMLCEVKFVMKDKYKFEFSEENIEYIVLT